MLTGATRLSETKNALMYCMIRTNLYKPCMITPYEPDSGRTSFQQGAQIGHAIHHRAGSSTKAFSNQKVHASTKLEVLLSLIQQVRDHARQWASSIVVAWLLGIFQVEIMPIYHQLFYLFRVLVYCSIETLQPAKQDRQNAVDFSSRGVAYALYLSQHRSELSLGFLLEPSRFALLLEQVSCNTHAESSPFFLDIEDQRDRAVV